LAHGFDFVNIVSAAGPQFGMPGYEPVLLYIAGLVALILGGAGAYSLDEKRARRSSGMRLPEHAPV
jgi:putative oxidoreductase